MGSRLSKPQNEEPQLYAVATPHPTLQYIYPVYAAPMELSATIEKSNTKGRKSPLAWRNDKSRTRKEIQVVGEHDERAPAVPIMAPNSTGTGLNEDGTWYHFHVDGAGAVDYIQPGTTLPNTFNEPLYAPSAQDAGSVAPSTSMAGVPYEESYYTYPASPPYQGYHHPQPMRPPPSDGYSTVSGYPHPHSPGPRHAHYPYDPNSQAAYSHAYTQGHPRARSVSPVYSRSITPSNAKPRRATTPTPRRSKTPTYDPAPPIPQHITPIPSSRRSATPFPKDRARYAPSPRIPTDGDDYIVDTRDKEKEREREPKAVTFATGHASGRTSRTSRRPSADRQVTDEDDTAISSLADQETMRSKSIYSRPQSPIPVSDTAHGINASTRERERERSSHKYVKYYPSPSTDASHPERVEIHA